MEFVIGALMIVAGAVLAVSAWQGTQSQLFQAVTGMAPPSSGGGIPSVPGGASQPGLPPWMYVIPGLGLLSTSPQGQSAGGQTVTAL